MFCETKFTIKVHDLESVDDQNKILKSSFYSPKTVHFSNIKTNNLIYNLQFHYRS